MRRNLLLVLAVALAVSGTVVVRALAADDHVEVRGYRMQDADRRVVIELDVPAAPCDGDLTLTWQTSPRQVTVAASLGDVRTPANGQCPLAARVVESSLLLPEPLGDRPVVDEATGQELPRLPAPAR